MSSLDISYDSEDSIDMDALLQNALNIEEEYSMDEDSQDFLLDSAFSELNVSQTATPSSVSHREEDIDDLGDIQLGNTGENTEEVLNVKDRDRERPTSRQHRRKGKGDRKVVKKKKRSKRRKVREAGDGSSVYKYIGYVGGAFALGGIAYLGYRLFNRDASDE